MKLNLKFIILNIVWRVSRIRFIAVANIKLTLAASMSYLLVATSFNHASEQPLSGILTEKLAVQLAVSNNPNLATIKSRYQALAELPSQVGTLPDPIIKLNALNFPTDNYDRAQEPMTQLQIGFSQEFPFPGKLNLKKQSAQYDAKAAGHFVDESRLKLIKNVKHIWWQLYYLDRALETVAINQVLLRQFIIAATSKYETGQGLQQDVLLSQLELSKLIDQNIQLQAIRRNQAIQLNILINQPANGQLMLPKQVSQLMPNLAAETELYKIAYANRPWLKQMETQVDAAKSRLNLAKRDYYPDFNLGMSYGDRTGNNASMGGKARSDLMSVMIGIKIPLYASRKQTKAVSQKNYELQQNRYALLDKKGLVMAEIASAITDYNRAKQQFSLFGNGIVPQAQQTVASMLAGYQVSEVDFLNLVRSQMTLLSYELQYWKALSEAKQALSRLEAAVGEGSIYE